MSALDADKQEAFEAQLAQTIQMEMSAVCGERYDYKSEPSPLAQCAAHVALLWIQRTRAFKCQCGNRITPDEQYRCFDCSEVFCKKCAKKHLYDESDHARLHDILRLRTQQLDIARLGRDEAEREIKRLKLKLEEKTNSRNIP